MFGAFTVQPWRCPNCQSGIAIPGHAYALREKGRAACFVPNGTDGGFGVSLPDLELNHELPMRGQWLDGADPS